MADKRPISSIRSVDRTHMIWPEAMSTTMAQAPQRPALGRFADSQTGFNFHVYCQITQLAPIAVPGPQDEVCAPFDESWLDTKRDYAADAGAPVIVSEWSSTDSAKENERMVDLMFARNLSWTAWQYYNDKGDDLSNNLGNGLLLDDERPGSLDNVRLDKLKAWSAPHPRRIAGTLVDQSWERGTAVTRLDYRAAVSAAASTGHRPARKSCSRRCPTPPDTSPS